MSAHQCGAINGSCDQSRVEFFVEEGLWLYPMGRKGTGWGSAFANLKSARVMAVRLNGDARRGELLADAEVRTNPARPWRNAEDISKAADALIQQGCLSRARGAPIELRELSAPTARIADMLRWTWHWFLPSVRQTIAWRLGLAPYAQWTIGVLPARAVQTTDQFPWDQVTWVQPPKDGMMADPFLVKDNGKHWLFYEQMLFGSNKGTLWAAQLDPMTGKLSNQREVLRKPHHLAFPNVFKVGGDWYMLPDQGQSGTTTLYRATTFPYQWEACRDLLPNFPGVDPVLYQHDGRWWLFVTLDVAPCVDNNLHLFWSDSLDGEFRPHPMNPVSTGLFGSRMAGPILKLGEKILRPGQDGRESYGHGVALYEIDSLTPTTYAERLVCAWAPQREGPFAHGFHSFQRCDELFAIDGQRLVRRDGTSYQRVAVMVTSTEMLNNPALGFLPTLIGV